MSGSVAVGCGWLRFAPEAVSRGSGVRDGMYWASRRLKAPRGHFRMSETLFPCRNVFLKNMDDLVIRETHCKFYNQLNSVKNFPPLKNPPLLCTDRQQGGKFFTELSWLNSLRERGVWTCVSSFKKMAKTRMRNSLNISTYVCNVCSHYIVDGS